MRRHFGFFLRSFFSSIWIFLVCSVVLTEGEVLEKVNDHGVVPREAKIATYPCTKCHQSYKKGEILKSEKHASLMFGHMPEIRNCVFCHSATRPNELNLSEGTPVGMNEAYKLCEQCHGKRAYDWKYGMHGKFTGFWNAERDIFNCTSCHNAHAPKFREMETVANPVESRFLIHKTEENHP